MGMTPETTSSATTKSGQKSATKNSPSTSAATKSPPPAKGRIAEKTAVATPDSPTTPATPGGEGGGRQLRRRPPANYLFAGVDGGSASPKTTPTTGPRGGRGVETEDELNNNKVSGAGSPKIGEESSSFDEVFFKLFEYFCLIF
jgi:hypothetical protein